MNRISIVKAFITGMKIYLSGAEKSFSKAMSVAFNMRKIVNDCIDSGMTIDEINDLFERAAQKQ